LATTWMPFAMLFLCAFTFNFPVSKFNIAGVDQSLL
jgi:hypothetical protein